jgi:hypothetical protein
LLPPAGVRQAHARGIADVRAALHEARERSSAPNAETEEVISP